MKKILLTLLLIGIVTAVVFTYWRTEVTRNMDNYVYSLPFKVGTSHTVVQGYGGLFSHSNIAALDFSMPVGTPIYAAREGVVFGFADTYDEGGPLPKYSNKANYLIIKHSDGSFGCYWHLQKNGVVVKAGKVTKGQLIGYSGSTGFVLRPHLHFSVKRKLNYSKDAFVRTKFNTTNGIEILQTSKTYTRPNH
jgi:murein DD-endopeptidase MepM/ murein hydrolase activator NlpD